MRIAIFLALVVLVLPALAYEEVDTSSATASAWSEYTPSYPASNAIDGSFTTFWTNNRTPYPTTDGAGNWFQVDWPDDIEVCYIRTEGRSYQGGFYSIPKEVRLHFSDASTLDFDFDDTTQDHWVQEYFFDADQKMTDFVKIEFLSYWHHVWEYIQYYETDFYYELVSDTDPPYVDEMDPDDGDTDVPVDADIVFHCKDDISPVDLDTIDFTVQDTTLRGDRVVSASDALSSHASPARTLPGDLDIDDSDPLDLVCTFTPDDDFYEGETITCTVAAGLADTRGNEMGDDFVWSFDTTPPIAVEDTTWGVIKAEF